MNLEKEDSLEAPETEPTPPPTNVPAASAQIRGLLAGLLAWAFGVRLWYASTGLDEGRFPDESFTLDNVASFLTQGSLRPLHLQYPGLGNLLQWLLLGAADHLARWTGRGSQTILHDWSFTPTAYFLARSLQAVIGVLTLYWTYRLGRRLLSPRAGLLAALALAAVPMHLRLSVVVKPDILMLLGFLMAVEATAAAISGGRLRYFLGAGAAVGLAASAKYNGAAAALPLALTTLPAARREPAVVVRLAAAGAASLLVFVLINPFFFPMLGKFQRNIGGTLKHYNDLATEAGMSGASHFEALRATPATIVDPDFHGIVTGLLGFAGLVATLVWAWRRRDRCLALLTAFPLAYISLYAAMTNYPKDNNYLPLCPFIALGAAALADEAGRRLRGRKAPIFAAVTALWCASLIWRPMAYSYVELVPTTFKEAELVLREKLSPLTASRVLYQFGTADDEFRLRDGRNRALVRQFDRNEHVGGNDLDLADAEVFTSPPLRDHELAGRLASALRVVRIVPGLFRARGGPLTLVLHPWAPAGEPIELEVLPSPKAGTWIGRLPEGLPFPLVVSFEVIVPDDTAAPDEVAAGTRRLELLPGGNHGQRCLSERLRLASSPGEVALTGPPDFKPKRLRLFLWTAPEAGP